MVWVLVALVIVGVAIAAFLVIKRKRSQRRPDGMKSFRRHMDALSSDARQNVIGRVRDADKRDKGGR